MRLLVWILEPDPAAASQLQTAWQTVAGDQADLRFFSSLPTPSKAAPDLLMAELHHRCDQVTELLLSLRKQGSTDFLPVTTDTSPSSFTRAQQLGAIDYILKPFTPRRLRQSLRRYLSLKQGLSAGCALTQGQLDLFFFSGSAGKRFPALALPDHELSFCKRILAFLLRCQGRRATALEVSQGLSVSRVTARKYLELLLSAGYVTKLSLRGQTGRPQYLYQLKEL